MIARRVAITTRTPSAPGWPGPVKAGTTFAATDEIGLASVEDRVGVPDWHATILYLMGLRHDGLFLDQHGLKQKADVG